MRVGRDNSACLFSPSFFFRMFFFSSPFFFFFCVCCSFSERNRFEKEMEPVPEEEEKTVKSWERPWSLEELRGLFYFFMILLSVVLSRPLNSSSSFFCFLLFFFLFQTK